MVDIRRIAPEISPEQLDQEAEVTPAVEREADLAAQRHGDALFNAMLDATPMPEEEETRDAL